MILEVNLWLWWFLGQKFRTYERNREIALHSLFLTNNCITEVWRYLSREKKKVLITVLLYDLINSQISNVRNCGLPMSSAALPLFAE